MKQRIKQFILGFALVIGIGAVTLPAVSVGAVDVDPLQGVCQSNPDSEVCQSKDDNVSDIVTTVINVLLFIVGIISVVMIIVAGILYATSGGDSTNIARAKNTLFYAIIGLVVAFLAFAIVNWVVGQFI